MHEPLGALSIAVMQTILAAKVETQERADRLTAALLQLGVTRSDVHVFYVNPPGQHAKYGIGGDQYADRHAAEAAKGQAAGAAVGAVAGLAVGGLAAAVVLPPVAPAVIAGVTGVGALTGSIAGAVVASKSGDASEVESGAEPPARRGGLMLAVRVDRHNESAVLKTMRDAGVDDIERAAGEWRDGQWADFDPLRPPKKIEEA